MTAFATVADFEDRHGVLPDDEIDKVAAFLDDATDLILDIAPDAWTAEDVPRGVKAICIAVAYRAWSNPDAAAQVSMGDVSISYTRGGTPDAIFLTKAEESRVRRASGGSRMVSVHSVSPYNGPYTDPLDWS